jgi:hypothetical protein
MPGVLPLAPKDAPLELHAWAWAQDAHLSAGTNLLHCSPHQIDAIARQCNNTPRRCFGFKTPAELFYNHLLHFKCESTPTHDSANLGCAMSDGGGKPRTAKAPPTVPRAACVRGLHPPYRRSAVQDTSATDTSVRDAIR